VHNGTTFGTTHDTECGKPCKCLWKAGLVPRLSFDIRRDASRLWVSWYLAGTSYL